MKTKLFNIRLVTLLVFIFFGALHLFIVLFDHYNYRTVALDYAVYNFAFFDYAHFRISPCPAYIFPFPATFLQDHFSLTLIFLSPLYWLMAPISGTYSLLIIQWIFILTGAFYTYKLILSKCSSEWLSILSVIFYFALFGRYSAYRADVNLAIMGSAILPLFIYLFDQGKKIPLILCYCFLLLNREDYSLWLVFITIMLMVLYRKDAKKLRLAFVLCIVACIFFFLVIGFIIPALEDENKKYNLFDFSAVGDSPLNAFIFILTHPLKSIELLFVNHSGIDYHNNIKLDFYLVYLASGAFLLLFRPVYLIAFIPVLAKKMYDDNPLRWSSETYYSVEIVSMLPLFVFLIIAGFHKSKSRDFFAIAVCVMATSVTIYKMSVPPPNPIVGESNKYNVVCKGFYQEDLQIKEINKMLKLIPADAAISGTGRIIPYLSFREKVYYFPFVNDAEYLALLKGDTYPLSEADFTAKVNALDTDPNWEKIKSGRELILYRRKKAGLSFSVPNVEKNLLQALQP